MIRRLKKDVLEQLPPKRRTVVTLPSLKDSVLENFKVGLHELGQLGDDASPFERGVLMNRMYVDTGKVKLEMVREYVKELCISGGKLLVFAAHLDMVEGIRSCVEKEKLGYMLISGETPPSERFENVQRFQENESCRVAILSIMAASQGLTLTAADTVVFAELHWTPGIIEQAENRAHRIGQKNSVNVHYLIAKGTLDDAMWRMINNKVKVTSTALDGKRLKLDAGKMTCPDRPAERRCPACGDPQSECTCVLDEDADSTGESGMTDVLREMLPGKGNGSFAETDVRFFLSGGAAKKRKEQPPPTNWACGACTYINKPADGNTKTCSICQTLRPRTTPSRTPEASSAAAMPTSRPAAPTSTVKFCVSLHTSRIFLFDADDEKPMGCNVTMNDALDGNAESLPVARRGAISETKRFALAWKKLRAIEQKTLCNHVIASATSSAARQLETQLARQGPAKTGGLFSDVRYTPKEVFAAAAVPIPTSPQEATPDGKPYTGLQAKRKVIGQSPLATAKKKGKAARTEQTELEEVVSSDSDGVILTGELPAVSPNAVVGSHANSSEPLASASPCTYCKKLVPALPWQGKKTEKEQERQSTTNKFCSHECWELYNTRVGNDIRRKILELEGGVCQICELDTRALFRSVSALEDVNDRRTLLMSTCFKKVTPARMTKMLHHPTFGQFWQADHIIPVCEGGGECDLTNLQTLCTMCHEKETSGLAPGIRKRKLQKFAEGTKDIRGFFGGNR